MSLPELTPQEVESKDQAFVLGTYARTSFHPRKGKGAQLTDADGKVYWDLLGGIAVNALGYSHPRLVKAMKEEASGVYHVSNLFYQKAQVALAEKLIEASGMAKVFFCNSGTEAIEASLKFARLATPGRHGVVAFDGSFHGRTFGALSMTGNEGYRTPFEPLVPGTGFIKPNDVALLDAAVDETTSAIVMEPIQGEGGIVPFTDAFLKAARAAADRVGAALILDEIQSGLGRTGSLFVFQQKGIVPDMITLAMLRVARQVAAQRLAARIVLQIHDELVLETPLAEVAAVERLLREEMLQALPLEVPLEVSVHAGATWAACEKGAPTG